MADNNNKKNTLPPPIQMANKALENLKGEVSDETLAQLKKKLPAFALQQDKAGTPVALDQLIAIAKDGPEALAQYSHKKPQQTLRYQDITERLQREAKKKAEKEHEALQKLIEQEKVAKEAAENIYLQRIMPLVYAIDQAITDMDEEALITAHENFLNENKKIEEEKGSYHSDTFGLTNSDNNNAYDLYERIDQLVENQDLERLKFLDNSDTDLNVPIRVIYDAAKHRHYDILDYYLIELEHKYPIMVDDYYSEDTIFTEARKSKDIKFIKYLINNGFSSPQLLCAEKVITDPELFDFAFETLHKTEEQYGGFLTATVKFGTFDQVKRIVDAGRYQTNGIDPSPDCKYQSNKWYAMRASLEEHQDKDLFDYLLAQSPTKLPADEIQHMFSFNLMSGNFNSCDHLHKLYPDIITDAYLNDQFIDKFKYGLRHHANDNAEQAEKDKKRDFDTFSYFIKKLPNQINKDHLNKIMFRAFRLDDTSFLDKSLTVYPFEDKTDLWQYIEDGFVESSSLEQLNKFFKYAGRHVREFIWDLTLHNRSIYQLGKLDMDEFKASFSDCPYELSDNFWYDEISRLLNSDDLWEHYEALEDVIGSEHFQKLNSEENIKKWILNGFVDHTNPEHMNEETAAKLLHKFNIQLNEDDLKKHDDIEDQERFEKIQDYLVNEALWQQKLNTSSPAGLTACSPYHYNEKLFKQLIPLFEKEGYQGESANQYAYQTAGLFGTMDRVMSYLDKWGYHSKHPLHNAVYDIKLPLKGQFDKAAWADAVIKHGKKMARLVQYAHKIPQPLKTADGKGWSYTKTFELSSQFVYERAEEHPELAKTCNDLNISEEDFNIALRLTQKFNALCAHKKKQNPNHNIPQVTISGESFGKPGYNFQRLESGDIQGLYLGHYTGCCQWLGGYGTDCAKHGFTSPNGGFYTVTNDNDEVVGQTWAWRGKKGELVFDSIETRGDVLSSENWYQLCNQLKDEFAANHKDITAFNIGTGGATPIMGFNHMKSGEAKPKDYKDYRDSESQYRVWKR